MKMNKSEGIRKILIDSKKPVSASVVLERAEKKLGVDIGLSLVSVVLANMKKDGAAIHNELESTYIYAGNYTNHPKVPCVGKTGTGKPCGHKANKNSKLCSVHTGMERKVAKKDRENRAPCIAITRKGLPCKAKAFKGGLCTSHNSKAIATSGNYFCDRCGRHTHNTDQCYAKKHLNGSKLVRHPVIAAEAPEAVNTNWSQGGVVKVVDKPPVRISEEEAKVAIAATERTDPIASMFDELKAFVIQKNSSYGNSVLDPVRVFSKADKKEQIRVRIDDKLSRLVRGNTDIESDTDIIKDLIGYLVLLLVNMEEN
jgi:hypothetical protein